MQQEEKKLQQRSQIDFMLVRV